MFVGLLRGVRSITSRRRFFFEGLFMVFVAKLA